jgi:hypothetical protein
MDVFWEIHVFLQINWIGLCKTQWTFLHLETVISRKYSFQKLLEYSQGKSVVDAAASNIHGFPSRDTSVSSTHQNRTLWNKMSLSPPWKLWYPGSIHFKILFDSHRETMCCMLLLHTQMVSFQEVHVFQPLRWIGLFGTIRAYIHLATPKLQEVFLSKNNPHLTGKQFGICSCF